MNSLTVQKIELPDALEDLSKFVLVGREKLVSVRAEIKAIDKLHLAEEVRNQKKSEAQMLSEALLDAEVKLGELLRKIPTAQGSRTDLELRDTAVRKLEVNKKSKHEVVQELGFTSKQAQRFEILANNQDIVEQVKQEARENDDIPTRTRVIDLAQRRNKQEKQEQTSDEFNAYIDHCYKTSLKYHDAVYNLIFLDVNESALKEFAEMVVNDMGNGLSISDNYISLIQEAIPKLLKIEQCLKEAKKSEKSNKYRK